MTLTTLGNHHPDGWLTPITSRLTKRRDYTALVVALCPGGFVFNEQLARQHDGKPLVIFDMLEYGVESYKNTHLLGVNSAHYLNGEYAKLDEWIQLQKVAAYFKREYVDFPLHCFCEMPLHPIDLLANIQAQPIRKDQFMSRVGGVMHVYGYSHQDRKNLHAALQVAFATTLNALDAAEIAASRRIPFHYLEQREHFTRHQMDRVQTIQGHCLLSCALAGNGVKTFRDCESITNSVPVVADLGMRRAIPFTDENAVLLPTRDGRILIDEAVQVIRDALQNTEKLWGKAQAANDMSRRCEAGNYVAHYINKFIEEALT